MNWAEDMNRMHKKYGVHEVVDKMDTDQLKEFLKFRIGCIQEEVDELKVAAADANADEAVDALIDMCVFAVGTLDLFGVNGYQAWNEVLMANLNKEVGIKEERPNPFGLPDLVKPEGWKAPTHEGNLGKFEEL